MKLPVHRPKIFQMTVPSSGTRYIYRNFRQVGWRTLAAHNPNAVTECFRGKPDLVWCHYSHAHKGIPEEFMELAQSHLIVCRDPILTWATNHVDWRDKDRPDSSKNKMAKSHEQPLLQCWEAQNFFDREWKPYVHRVDMDNLAGLEAWADVKFEDGASKYSTKSRMKEAVKERDVDKIEWLCEGTDYWTWFKKEATPVFHDFYTEMGYDLWWV